MVSFRVSDSLVPPLVVAAVRNGALLLHLAKDMWTYIVGPFLALLPRRWQKALPYSDAINWPHAVTLSGLAELAVALAATVEWYSISMATWVNRGLDVAMNSSA